MRILITGATGFIGRRVCQRFHDDGHEVWGLSRDQNRARVEVPVLSGCHFWEPELGPPAAESFEGVEAVVHLAAERISGIWTAAKKRSIRSSRVVGTRNLVAGMAAAESKPIQLITMSAVGYYGSRSDEELAEDATPGSDFLAETCVAWEREAQPAEEMGVRVAWLRMAPVLSKENALLASMLLPYRLGLGGPIGSGRQWWPWVHMADSIEAFAFVLDRKLNGPINLAAPGIVTQAEFAKCLGRVLRRPAILPFPAFALRLVLGGLAAEILSSKMVVPSRLSESGFTFQFPDLELALRNAIDS